MKYLISVPSWSRGFTPAYHTEGLRFKTRLGQKKSFSFFFNFFLDLAKISTKPKVDFRDTAGFFDRKNKFCL